MKRPRSFRAEDVTIEVLEHYRQFAAQVVMHLGEEFVPAFLAIDDEISARQTETSAMDRIRQYARKAA